MDFGDAKTGNLIEKASAVGLGFVAFVKTATAKYEVGGGTTYGIFSKYRIEDALANIVGPQIVTSIDSSYNNVHGASQAFAPMKALNYTTEVGAGILITDYVLRKVVPTKYYKSLPVVPDLMRGAGIGILVGGIVGGIFDPNPSGYTAVSPSPVTGQMETGGVATGNVPYGRAGSTSRIYGSGSVLA